MSHEELIARAEKLANIGVMADDGFQYLVPAAKLSDYSSVITELVSALREAMAAHPPKPWYNPDNGARASRQLEQHWLYHPEEPDIPKEETPAPSGWLQSRFMDTK